MKEPKAKKHLIPRQRIPVLDPLVDACRFLPMWLQFVVFLCFLPFFYFLPQILFSGYWRYWIIGAELFFLLVLLYKFMIYRRISKIEQAIKHRVIWIKTNKDQQLIMRFLALGTLLTGIAYGLYRSEPSEFLFLALGLLCLLFYLKALFYVPSLYFRLLEEKEFQIVNEYKEKSLSLEAYLIDEIAIRDRSVWIKAKEEELEFEVHFDKKRERTRLKVFLARVLKGHRVVVH